MYPSFRQLSNAVHRKQSLFSGQQAASFNSTCASERQRHPGQATRSAGSRRDKGGKSTSAGPKRSRKVRYLHSSWETGPEGRDGRGQKVPQRLPPGNKQAFQKLVGKPVPDSDGFRERVDRKCVQCSWIGIRIQGRKGYLGSVVSRVPCGKRESGFATLRDC